MNLVALIALVMAFVLTARFLKIFDKAVDWLYIRFPAVDDAPDQEPEEDKEPDIKLPPLMPAKEKRVS